MAEHKTISDRLPPEETAYFPQWTTFSWENVTDAMRKSIRENNSKPSNASGTASIVSLQADADSKNKNAASKHSRLSELGENDRQVFADSAQFFKEITSPDEHPSQLVDALKVGLADILEGPGSDDDVSIDDFSKSLDTSFNEKLRATQTIGTIPDRSCLTSTGSSESEDDVSDLSTTESRESVGVESTSMNTSAELHQSESVSDLRGSMNVENPVTGEERPETVTSSMLAEDKETECEFPSIPEEQPNVESNKEGLEEESLEIQNDTTQLDDGDTSFEQQENGDIEESDFEMEKEQNSWGKDILAEDLVFVENYEEEVEQTELADACMNSPQPVACHLDNAPDEDRVEFLQREDDTPSRRTYADVVKVGLDPDAICYVMKPASPPLYQKRTPKELKRKSARKFSKKEKRVKRTDIVYGKRDAGREFHEHRERRGPQGKRASSTMPGGVSPQTHIGHKRSSGGSSGRYNASPPGPKVIQEKAERAKKTTRNKHENLANKSIQCDANVKNGENNLRKKIKEENIAKVLQEAKLTLAKLTTESLGSYEKVSCLKLQQPPVVCFNTFEVLQTQEINKSKHMKELANRLHQLTEMGVGNSEEFTEIKDILYSLHYLQTKDKYFVEPKDKTTKKVKLPLKKAHRDKSVYWFLMISMVFLILLFIFRRQWMAFGIFSSLFVFCIQQVKKILEFFDGNKEKDDTAEK